MVNEHEKVLDTKALIHGLVEDSLYQSIVGGKELHVKLYVNLPTLDGRNRMVALTVIDGITDEASRKFLADSIVMGLVNALHYLLERGSGIDDNVYGYDPDSTGFLLIGTEYIPVDRKRLRNPPIKRPGGFEDSVFIDFATEELP